MHDAILKEFAIDAAVFSSVTTSDHDWLNLSASLSTPSTWQHDRVRASCLTTRPLCTNQMQDDVYCVCLVDAASQSVATHNPDVPYSRFARTVSSMRRGFVHERKRQSCPLHAWHKKCTCDLIVTRNRLLVGPRNDISFFWGVLVRWS